MSLSAHSTAIQTEFIFALYMAVGSLWICIDCWESNLQEWPEGLCDGVYRQHRQYCHQCLDDVMCTAKTAKTAYDLLQELRLKAHPRCETADTIFANRALSTLCKRATPAVTVYASSL
jgi:hypothetical protein